MAQPNPTTAESGDFIPVLTTDTDQASTANATTTTALRLDDHEPKGVPEERQTILSGFPSGNLGQTIALPIPRIVHDFRMSATLDGKIPLGQSCWGERNWIGISGGDWSATWGRGTVVVGVACEISCDMMGRQADPSHRSLEGRMLSS